MKKLLFLLITSLMIYSCTKDTVMPDCGTVLQMRDMYNNTTEWKYLGTELVMDFGYQCGEFYTKAYKERFDTFQFCSEPVLIYWVFNQKQLK